MIGTENDLTIAIASDLHCTYGGDSSNSTSYLLSDLSKRPIHRHPIESLKKMIQNERLHADLLLCPGDITDKINKQGLISGWQFLHEIKMAIGANALAITLGNHDVDSRNHHGAGAFELVKNLDDFIPTNDPSANDSFWRNDYCILQSDRYQLLILNSSFNHTSPELASKSQIAITTIERIEHELSGSEIGRDTVRIVMCHHHPIHHSNSNLTYHDSDFIDKSDRLLLLLERQNFNLVIHGHKHDPRLIYFNSLPILACGSFSGMANLLDIGAQNTFHIVKVNPQTKKGIVHSWIYQPLSGWTQKLDCYFPCFTGFGFRTNIDEFAKLCYKWFTDLGKESIAYPELVAKFPDIRHMIPSDQKLFNEIMKAKYKVAFSPPLPNQPERVFNL